MTGLIIALIAIMPLLADLGSVAQRIALATGALAIAGSTSAFIVWPSLRRNTLVKSPCHGTMQGLARPCMARRGFPHLKAGFEK